MAVNKGELFAINGRIFEYPITGVGRFCYEVIKEMDALVQPGQVCLLISGAAQNVPELHNIEILRIGSRQGIFWEQIEMPLYLKKRRLKCLSMSSSVPLLAHDYIQIHDISLKVNHYEGTLIQRVKKLWPLLQYRVGINRSRILFTISQFSAQEINREYGLSESKPVVVYAGWQHMNRIVESEDVLERYGLEGKEYFFAVSTRTKNKNFRWILDAAKHNPRSVFVVAGKLDSKFFSDETDLDKASNIRTVGYISDEDMKGLMRHAQAFLFPSIYEGFGIPPLEALSVGTKAVVGRASCLPEIYGDTVYYIDPWDASVDLPALLAKKVVPPAQVLTKYSWAKTANKILSEILRTEGISK